MKAVRYALFPALLLLFAAGPACAEAQRPSDPDEVWKLKRVGELASKVLSDGHFRRQKQNAAFSSRVFDRYLQMLDPGKTYFTAEDIALLEKDRFYLLEQLSNGKLDAVFAIYDRFLARLEEYRSFADRLLKAGFDFTVEESYRPDRKDAVYCADDAELHELWRKKIKNDLLYFRLMQRMMNEEAAKDPEVAAEMKKRWNLKTPEEKIRTRLHDVGNQMTRADKMDILGMFLTSLAQSYGPHSHYSTPKQDEDFDIQFKLSLSGIGATLTSEDGYTKVVELVPNGPAAKDGRLKPEDRIIAVAQENGVPVDVIDMPVANVVKFVRGPAKTKVTLTVLSAEKGASAMPEDITIVRDNVELTENAAKGDIRNVRAPDGSVQRIGVITLNNFYMDFDGAMKGLPDYRSCTRDIRRILQDFAAKKTDGVLLDLRGNSGGSLVEAITLSGLFIPSGPVVQIMDSSRRIDVQYDPDPALVYAGPLAVLTSKFSASSAEILTGAIKDYHRGPVIGDTRTYGKGTVLGMKKLSDLLGWLYPRFDAGSITYETAMFYRINGESNQQRGVTSDIVLPSFTEEMDVGELFNPNHLPWNRISALPSPDLEKSGYTALTPEIAALLQKHSTERFARDPELKKLRTAIMRFRKMRDRGEVSLNEERRVREYHAEKAANDAADAMMEAEDGRKSNKTNDLLLREALTVTAEYVTLLKPERMADARR